MNETLLLIGHGSVRYPDAGHAMQRHAAALRADGHFAQVEVAVLNGTPSVAEALARIAAPVVRVVPFFMEDGYFSRVATPRAVVLAEAALAGGQNAPLRITLCPPVGVHDGVAGVIERQALAACTELGVPSHTAAVVVIGHGSAIEPGRSLALHRHAARVASTTLFARVEASCLEEAPFVADTLASLRSHPVVVIGFFANQGGHVRDDVPALIAAEAAASDRQVRFQGSVTDDPAMVQIILDQARR
jgi:sirohydrochlorin cobaltochelatase